VIDLIGAGQANAAVLVSLAFLGALIALTLSMTARSEDR
jgi:hypothetical protein